jgi:hypothetical protein
MGRGEEGMRDLKFRAWDKYHKRYMNHKEINILLKNVNNNNSQFEFERFLGLEDKNEKEVCAGDIRIYHGKKYKVVDDIWRFRLERNLVEFGENEWITIDEDVAFESEFTGTIHGNPESLN